MNNFRIRFNEANMLTPDAFLSMGKLYCYSGSVSWKVMTLFLWPSIAGIYYLLIY